MRADTDTPDDELGEVKRQLRSVEDDIGRSKQLFYRRRAMLIFSSSCRCSEKSRRSRIGG